MTKTWTTGFVCDFAMSRLSYQSKGIWVLLTVTLDASSPGVLLPFDVPDVRRIELLRRGPTGLALFSTGEVAPVPLDTPNWYANFAPWLIEPPPLRELPRFLPLGST